MEASAKQGECATPDTVSNAEGDPHTNSHRSARAIAWCGRPSTRFTLCSMNDIRDNLPLAPIDQVRAESERRWLERLTRHVPPCQFLRYLFVGGGNTVFGYSTFALINFLLTRWHVLAPYIYAMVVSNFISITVAYLGYKVFVFKTKGNYLHEWARCMAVYWSAALPGFILMPIIVRLFANAFQMKGTAP